MKHRDRPPVTITLSPEATAACDQMAQTRGMSRSGFIEFLIREQSFRDRLDLSRLRRGRPRRRRK